MKKINLILLGAFLVKSVFAGETAPMPEPEVRLESFADYQDWAVNTGYPCGTLIPGGVDGINQDSFRTLPGTDGYDSGRIVVGDSRCCQMGIYQQRACGDSFAVFATWGGHYKNSEPRLDTEEFYQSVEDCFHRQVEEKRTCSLYFFATVNDYDFVDNNNEESIQRAVSCAEKLASMEYEYNGEVYNPTVTVIGIATGATDKPVLRYEPEQFNRYGDEFNELLKKAVTDSPVLNETAERWTTVPEILNNGIGFIDDGLHYDDTSLKALAEYVCEH